MKPAFLLLYCLFCIAGLGFGLFMLLDPGSAIEAQRRFYSKINWKIEPISMGREMRNTRIMGLLITVSLLAAVIYLLLRFPPR